MSQLHPLFEHDIRFGSEINQSVYRNMGTHLGVSDIDLSASDRQEFSGIMKDADTYQPLNVMRVARDKLGIDNETEDIEVLNVLSLAMNDWVQECGDRGVDVIPARRSANEIVSYVEGLITTYTRSIGIKGAQFELENPDWSGVGRWNEFVWTPEEESHSILGNIVSLTSSDTDMAEWQNGHVDHMQTGIHVHPSNKPYLGLGIYLAQQEGATVDSHDGATLLSGPLVGPIIGMPRPNEAKHTAFYTKVVADLAPFDPDYCAIMMLDEFMSMQMPGLIGVPRYGAYAKTNYISGVLGGADIIDAQRKIIDRVKLTTLDCVSDAGRYAKDALLNPDGNFGLSARNQAQNRQRNLQESSLARAYAKGLPLPAIIGLTIPARGQKWDDLEWLANR